VLMLMLLLLLQHACHAMQQGVCAVVFTLRHASMREFDAVRCELICM
jgi:hypothetical protein